MASIFNSNTLLLGCFVLSHGIWLNGMTFAATKNAECEVDSTIQDCQKSLLDEIKENNENQILMNIKKETKKHKKQNKGGLMGSFMQRIKGKVQKKARVDAVPIESKNIAIGSENMEDEIYKILWNIDEKSQGCQSNYLNDSGMIHFSNKELSGNWRLCFWTIDTSSTFEIAFQSFSMNSCEHLIVGNGISLAPIATLSGSIVPGSVRIPHTRAYILFISSCQTKTAEFSLSWNTVDRCPQDPPCPADCAIEFIRNPQNGCITCRCSTSVTQINPFAPPPPACPPTHCPADCTTETIRDPNTGCQTCRCSTISDCNSSFNNDYGEMHYPPMRQYNIQGISDDEYNNNENCSWVISSSRPLNISFHMLSTEECCDFLYVRDGSTSKSDLLAILRGTNKTLLITTTSNSVHLQFTTDYSNVGRGFSILWAVIEEVFSCGGTYSSESGTIVHPSMSGSYYGNNENCTWIIISSLPLDIYFGNFSTETCCDHLSVRDGHSIESQLLGRFSGASIPDTLTTKGDAFLHFQSDGNVGSTGFVLHWNISTSGGNTKECNEHLNTDSGSLQYPESGDSYPDNADCTWVIETSGPRIELTFTRFSIESCCDFVYIRDGDSSSAPLLGRYSGNTLPLSVRTTTNKAFVRFVSNGSNNQNGFVLTWNTVGCGAVYNEEIGMIDHPEGDKNYKNNENCTWIIRAFYQININFVEFDTENNYDYLYIRDGSSIASPVLERFSGAIVPISVQTNTNVAHLSFTSDRSITRTGFKLQWDATVCGAQYNSNSGMIRHPLNDENYKINEECNWIIRAAYPINITFIRFDTEGGFDFLIVRDGETTDSPVLGRYSGSDFPQTVQTSTNAAHLEFTSDYSSTRSGFALQWYSKDCGGYYRNDSGEIRFPEDGGLYDNNEDCVWVIETSGSQIELSFENFSTEATFDILVIRDGSNSGSPLIGNFSGNFQSPVRTGTGQAYLSFTSDGSVAMNGFIIHWNIAEAEGNPECSCGSVNSYQEITGGEEVEYSVKYPWHVGIFNPRLVSFYFCGGTLISDRYVITAAHCIPNQVIDGLKVRIGDHLQLSTSDDIEGVTETFSIEKVYIHPRNERTTYNNDLALLRLSRSITFTDDFGIRPICLPSNPNKTYTGELGLSVGWGKLFQGAQGVPNTLRQVEMTILSPDCRNWRRVTPSMICAYSEGKDTCQGDSGGSLIVLESGSNELVSEQPEHHVLVGVTSWGIGCAARTPGVYSRVTMNLDWIHRFVVTCDRRGAE